MEIEGLLIDIDGVLTLSWTPIDGAVAAASDEVDTVIDSFADIIDLLD